MPDPRPAKAWLLRLATYASVATALLLIAGKLVAWLLTGSVSVLASLIDSMLDAAASTVNLIAVHYSLQPPDDEHRYGHGKAEPLAGLGQAMFIAGSAVFLSLQAIDRLRHPQPLSDIGTGTLVMIAAVVITLALVTLQRYVIQRTDSTAIRADSLHYLTDVLSNLVTVAALLLSLLGWNRVDPLFALGIAGYILYSAGRIGHEAFQLLLDHELPPADQARIESLVRSQPDVQGLHGLRTRRSGQTVLIELHLELAGDQSLSRAWTTAHTVKHALRQAFPEADVILQLEPVAAAEASAPTDTAGSA